jgi:hypothetical protein
MMYFDVFEMKATKVMATKVASDGTPVEQPTLVDTDTIIEYAVYEYDEDGSITGTKHYIISEYHDEQDMLEQIKEDHPAPEWQNHNW